MRKDGVYTAVAQPVLEINDNFKEAVVSKKEQTNLENYEDFQKDSNSIDKEDLDVFIKKHNLH